MSNGTDYDEMYGSKYLAATELKGPTKVTINHVDRVTFEKPGEVKRTKAVLYFVGAKKAMVLNKTNADALAAAFGRDFDDWPGKRATLKVEHTTFGGKRVPCLRLYPVEELKPNPNITTGSAAAAMPDNEMEEELHTFLGACRGIARPKSLQTVQRGQGIGLVLPSSARAQRASASLQRLPEAQNEDAPANQSVRPTV